jgi:serine/threonine-protein kinase
MNSKVSQDLESVISKCLEKDPGQRFQDTQELVDALKRLQTAGAFRRARFRRVVPVFIVVLLGVVLGIWMISQERSLDPVGRVASSRPRSLAVLPFQNLGEGQEATSFTDGIHAEILNRLAKIGELKVISRTSMMEYRETTKNLMQIADELGVATVLEGSVQRAGDQYRIIVQLIDAKTDENLWAESYSRKLSVSGIFSTQSDIALRVATALHATLTADERERIAAVPTTDVEAYILYLRGLELLHRPGQLVSNIYAAREYFEEAVALDPTFALAYAGLSRAARDQFWLIGGNQEDLDVAMEAATRALELQPELPEAHLALGTVLYVQRDYDRAQDEMNVALLGLPGNSELLRWLGYIARRLGDWDTALEHLQRARGLNPREAEATNEVGLTLLCMRRYDEALSHLDLALELAPHYPLARVYRAMTPVLRDGTEEAVSRAVQEFGEVPGGPWKYAHGWQLLLYARDFEGAIEFVTPVERVSGQWYDYPRSLLIGWSRFLQGRSDEAMAGFDEAVRILEPDLRANPDDARLHSSLALAYAGLGRKEEALREGRRSVEIVPLEMDAFTGAWLLQDLAWVYTMTGELDAAVETLDRVLSVPSVWSIEALLLDPRVDPLRGHGGFEKLVKKYRRRD